MIFAVRHLPADHFNTVAKTDYGCNAGNDCGRAGLVQYRIFNFCPITTTTQVQTTMQMAFLPPGMQNWFGMAQASTGVMFPASQVSPESVTDGVSNTYLLGEKYLPPDDYTNGGDLGGITSKRFMGFNAVIGRWGG